MSGFPVAATPVAGTPGESLGVTGTAAGITLAEDMSTRAWHDPNYPYALNRFTALHYFEHSDFFDRNSNNTVARQRGLDPGVPGVLESMDPGLEFVVEVDQPPNLFVIKKQLRRSRDEKNAAVLAYFYILDKVVYQAPTMYAALSARIRRCVWNIQEGIGKMQADLDPLLKVLKDQDTAAAKKQQQQQQQPDGAQPPEAAAAGGAGEAPLPMPRKRIGAEERAHWVKTDNIIMNVLRKYPLPEVPKSLQQPQQAQQQPTQQHEQQQQVPLAAAAPVPVQQQPQAQQEAMLPQQPQQAAVKQEAAFQQAEIQQQQWQAGLPSAAMPPPQAPLQEAVSADAAVKAAAAAAAAALAAAGSFSVMPQPASAAPAAAAAAAEADQQQQQQPLAPVRKKIRIRAPGAGAGAGAGAGNA